MAWELPPSIGRSLNRLAISRVQGIEGDDTIVPTVELLSLDRPPFRQVGHRFFAAGAITSDATGGSVVLSTTSNKCTVVVDSILINVSATARVLLQVGSGFLPGNGFAYVPAVSLSRPLPEQDLRLTDRLGTAGGSILYIFEQAPFAPLRLETEIVLLVPPPSAISGDVYLAANILVTGITLFVSFSGRIWYSEE